MVYQVENEPVEIPNVLPLLPVRDIVVYSYMFLPLFVGRENSIKAVEEAMGKDRLILLATQKDPAKDTPEPDDVYEVGTIAMIMKKLKLPDNRIKIRAVAVTFYAHIFYAGMSFNSCAIKLFD